MADAYILETSDDTAGIVVAEPGGVRFYASAAAFNQLDGVLYRSLKAARSAVEKLSQSPGRDGEGRFSRAA